MQPHDNILFIVFNFIGVYIKIQTIISILRQTILAK